LVGRLVLVRVLKSSPSVASHHEGFTFVNESDLGVGFSKALRGVLSSTGTTSGGPGVRSLLLRGAPSRRGEGTSAQHLRLKKRKDHVCHDMAKPPGGGGLFYMKHFFFF
jgi:hypothetical protein